MADLIDRQAVQEMVDRIGDIHPYRQIGNRESYSQYNEAWTDAINRVDAELNSLPSTDAVEVVRCKDCKHWIPYDWMFSEVWKSQNIDDYTESEIGCTYCDMSMGAVDYCSRGERKDG